MFCEVYTFPRFSYKPFSNNRWFNGNIVFLSSHDSSSVRMSDLTDTEFR